MKKLILILLLIGLSVIAEETMHPDVEIEGIELRELYSPLYQNEEGDDSIQVSGMPLYQSRQKKWLQVATSYRTRPEWIDQLTLEFYVLLPTPEKKTILFKGVTTYIDIPESRDHLAEMYIHFNSYERHYGRGKIQTAVVAKMDGKVVSVDKRNSLDDPWWEKASSHPVGLLKREETPFRVVNIEKYEATLK